MEETKVYDTEAINSEVVRKEITDIYDNLEQKGYDSIKQITGYLLSGDPGYISNYKESRNRIVKIDRVLILETLLKDYIK